MKNKEIWENREKNEKETNIGKFKKKLWVIQDKEN